MTEIQFLVQLLLTETMEESLKSKLLKRIEEVELTRLTLNNPLYSPIVIPYFSQQYCLHEFPLPYYGTGPATCKKCGALAGQNTFQITSANSLVKLAE